MKQRTRRKKEKTTHLRRLQGETLMQRRWAQLFAEFTPKAGPNFHNGAYKSATENQLLDRKFGE